MNNGKKDRILRILFNTNKNPTIITKYQISKLANCSESWVGEFIRNLQKKGFVNEKNKIIKKKELYNYWTENVPERKHRDYLVQNPMELLSKIKGLDFTFTTYMGDAFTHHYLFPSRIDIYIKEKDLNSWINNVFIPSKALVGKGNVRIILSDEYIFDYSQKKFSKTHNREFTIVSKPQLILDLLLEGGTCIEAAEELMEED